MSAVRALGEPRRIKASHRRRRKCTTAHRVYANDNPYRFTDPDGRATVYDYANGPEVIVQTFVNNGTQFTDKQIEQQGANLSGQTSQGQHIIVVLTPGNDKDAVHINANSKLDDTSSNGAMRSHTDKIGGRDVEVAPNAQSASTVGHEIGHVLDAGDQYKGGEAANGKTLAKDVPGSTNIMKNAVGNANTQTMNEISKGAASPQNTHVSCQMKVSGGC